MSTRLNYNPGDRVQVRKTFRAVRTPCPAKGTEGTVVESDNPNFILVSFKTPFVDSEGRTWVENSENEIRIYFLPSEISGVRKAKTP